MMTQQEREEQGILVRYWHYHTTYPSRHLDCACDAQLRAHCVECQVILVRWLPQYRKYMEALHG